MKKHNGQDEELCLKLLPNTPLSLTVCLTSVCLLDSSWGWGSGDRLCGACMHACVRVGLGGGEGGGGHLLRFARNNALVSHAVC